MRSMYVHKINLSRTSFLVLFSVPVLGGLELKERSVVKVVFGEVGTAKQSVPDEVRKALPVRTTLLSLACDRFLCRWSSVVILDDLFYFLGLS